jgi:hypothetical protein
MVDGVAAPREAGDDRLGDVLRVLDQQQPHAALLPRPILRGRPEG